MMPTADLSDQTVARLQKIAVPLQDTYDTVIARLLDAYETQQGDQPKKSGEPLKTEGRVMFFHPHNPPPLGFTTVTEVVVDGQNLPKEECYWNKIMERMVREAAKRNHSAKAIDQMLFANSTIGEKSNNGYHFIQEAGVSVQYLDANGASRQSFDLAEKLGVSLKVDFYWQPNEKAVHPNSRGVLEI